MSESYPELESSLGLSASGSVGFEHSVSVSLWSHFQVSTSNFISQLVDSAVNVEGFWPLKVEERRELEKNEDLEDARRFSSVTSFLSSLNSTQGE